jgi:hypothetical protein
MITMTAALARPCALYFLADQSVRHRDGAKSGCARTVMSVQLKSANIFFNPLKPKLV